MTPVAYDSLERGRSYPFVDFPIEFMPQMQARLEQRGWRIADRVPRPGTEFPPIPHGFARRHGLDWVGPEQAQAAW